MMKLSLLVQLILVVACFAQIPDEDWGYITISPETDSHMFWWLYGAQQTNRQNVPLVMWLQGGPGGSSLFGDFIEIGPLDWNLKARNTTWLSQANLLFVDNPIGTGFSYTNNNGFCTTDEQIADQLLILLKGFLAKYPVFATIDFWVFCESYGGKMTANFGAVLAKAIENSEININFKGVGLGDGWLDPIGCMYSYSAYLETIGQIDDNQASNLTAYAQQAEEALNSGDGVQATNIWGLQQSAIEEFTGGVNFYDFLHFDDYIPEAGLGALINGPIRQKLGIIPDSVTWGGQSDLVFSNLQGAFMKSAYSSVDYLLSKGYQVAVYNGQLDIIVDNLCTEGWIKKLNWPYLKDFQNSSRQIVTVNGATNGYFKSFKNLSFWIILDAGHMVPYDNGPTALQMFTTILSSVNRN